MDAMETLLLFRRPGKDAELRAIYVRINLVKLNGTCIVLQSLLRPISGLMYPFRHVCISLRIRTYPLAVGLTVRFQAISAINLENCPAVEVDDIFAYLWTVQVQECHGD